MLFVGEGTSRPFGSEEEEAGAAIARTCGAVLAAARLSTRHTQLRAAVVSSSSVASGALRQTAGELHGTAVQLDQTKSKLEETSRQREAAASTCIALQRQLDRIDRRLRRREAELQSAREEATEGVAAAAAARSEKAKLEHRIAVLRRAALVREDGNEGGEADAEYDGDGEGGLAAGRGQSGVGGMAASSSALLRESAWAQRAHEAEAAVAAAEAKAAAASTKWSGAIRKKETLQ